MSEQSSPSQRNKPNVKISSMVLSRPSTMNAAKAMLTASKTAIPRSASNPFFETLEKIQSRIPTIRLESKSLCYEKLRVTSSLQYFREDWGGITAIRYFQDGEKMAVGFNSGEIQTSTHTVSHTRCGSFDTILKGWEGNDSVSCIQFHPKKPSVLYASSTAGTVMRRDLDDQTNYNDFFISEAGNEIYSIDFTNNCELVTAGRDATIRVYDASAQALLCEFGESITSSTMSSLCPSNEGLYHEKRVYCVRCHPSDPYMFVSGGWDGVKVWDTRTQGAVRSIVGPFIFGDAVDVCKGMVLTASCVASNSLQLWDLGSGFLIDNVDPPNKRASLYGEYPYVARFFQGEPTGDLVLYGVNGLQIISIKESSTLYLFEDEKPIGALDSTEKKFAFGGKSNSVLYGKVLFPDIDISSSNCSSTRTASSRSEQSAEFGSQNSDVELET